MDDRAPLVFVGGITFDSIAAVAHYPAPDERIVADTVVHAGGGPAATAAVAAARLGATGVCFVGAVGEDQQGDQLVAGLAREGIDVAGVVRVAGAVTGSSVAVVDASAGTRAICARPGPTLELDPRAADLVHAGRWVHVDHVGWAAVTATLDPVAHQHRPRLSVDVSYPVPGFRVAGVDLYVPALASLAATYPDVTVVKPSTDGGQPTGTDALLAAVLADGARCVVATRGADGCVAATAAGDRYTTAGYTVDALSTLGAGDVFHGALLAAVDRGDPLIDAMTYANVVAALSCRGLDGRSAIPSHAETMTALGTHTSSARPPAPTR